jgi:hypothetical protein
MTMKKKIAAVRKLVGSCVAYLRKRGGEGVRREGVRREGVRREGVRREGVRREGVRRSAGRGGGSGGLPPTARDCARFCRRRAAAAARAPP